MMGVMSEINLQFASENPVADQHGVQFIDTCGISRDSDARWTVDASNIDPTSSHSH